MIADLDIQVWWDWRDPIPFFEAEDYTVEFDDGKVRFLKRHIWIVPVPFLMIHVVILKKVDL